MKTLNAILILACAVLAPAVFASTSITTDIVADTVWDHSGSPYQVRVTELKVRSGATLTVDSSAGDVEIEFRRNGTDFHIGNGSGDEGYLVLSASSGNILWQFRDNCNLVINSHGQMTSNDATTTTVFDGNSSGDEWGALVFEAGQNYRSSIKNCSFEQGGYDGKDAAVVVESTADNTPQFEDLSFNDCNVSAIRFDGNGINTLRQDGLKLPLSVTNTDYVFYLNAVTSTVPIRFPDPDTPDAPENKLSGTCTVGGSTAAEVSHWRFDDGYTFDCVASSKVDVVNGSVWGTEESRPTFQSISGTPGFSDWSGLQDNNTSHTNLFGDLGSFGFLTVRDASIGVYYSKDSTGSFLDGKKVRLVGLEAYHCAMGIWVAANDGIPVVESATTGGTTSTDWCTTTNIIAAGMGVAEVVRCTMKGSASGGRTFWLAGAKATVIESRISGPGAYAVNTLAQGGRTDLTLIRTIVDTTATIGVYAAASNWLGTDGACKLRMNHCSVTAGSGTSYAVLFGGATNAPVDVVIEDCTISGGYYGIRAAIMKAGASAQGLTSNCLIRKTNVIESTYGAYLASHPDSTLEYVFEECFFSGNTFGLYDARTQTARAVATRCTFQGNSSYAAYDASGGSSATDMLAEFCYWNSDSGPAVGPGLDDVTTTVDWGSPDDYLARPYFDVLIGGSPASAAEWDVWENSSTPADNLHVIDNTPFFKWTFASDFEGDTQSAYEIEVEDDPVFGEVSDSPLWDSTKVTSSAGGVDYPSSGVTALANGTVYYARIRLWNDVGMVGPWRYLKFRMNTAPAQVGNSSRLPANSVVTALKDHTPTFIWERPLDSDEDPLHFELFLERREVGSLGNAGSWTVRSWTTSTNSSALEIDARPCFQMSTDSGETWLPLPDDGAPSGSSTIVIRLIWPDEYALTNSADTILGPNPYYYTWAVRAHDDFEYGSYSTTYSFEIGREYTISGQLQNNSGTGVTTSKTVHLYVNGSDYGDTDATGTVSMVDGRFDIVTYQALEIGDVLWVYVDGETEKGAAIFHFTGEDMTFDGDDEDIILRDQCLYLYQTLDDHVIENDDLQIYSADTDIPWTYSGGTVTFEASLDADPDPESEGVFIAGQWDLTGVVDGTSLLDTVLNVTEGGRLRTLGHNASFHALTNSGSLEVLGGTLLTLNGANSTTSGDMIVDSSILNFSGGSSLSLTVDKGVLDVRRGSTIRDLTAYVSELIVDSVAILNPAVLTSTDTTFDEVRVTVAIDGVLAAFNDNTFQNDVSVQHIDWRSESPLSATQMCGVQFNSTLNGTSTYNVKATADAVNLTMIGCGGTGHGELYEDDTNDRIDWELASPTGLSVLVGDGRLRLEWDATGQTGLANTGFNVYRSTSEGGTYTKINGSTVTNNYYNDDSLTNGTAYWYYITVLDENPAPDQESGQSNRVSATPIAASIVEVSPSATESTSVLALTALGEGTHWDDASTTVIVTENDGGGSTGAAVNDKVVISPYLTLVDVTLSGASAETWKVQITENDVWGIAAYDEVESGTFTVTSNADETRPTIAFTSPTASADVSTVGDWTITVTYNAQGGTIDASSLELMASRDVTVQSGVRTPGTDLSAISGFWNATPGPTSATCTVNNSGATELFSDGEYILSARIANNNGEFSEWVTRRFYVNGSSASVVKVPDQSGVRIKLYQGDSERTIKLSGSGLSASPLPDFGSDIFVHSATVTGSGSGLDVVVSVDELAECGPIEFTTNSASKTGILIVEYPTNILPTVTNAEPSRNPAIGGVNVFLKNGAFFKSETDIATRGRMMGMSWSRFYRSDIAYDGPLGHGWVGHYYQRALIDAASSDIWWYTPDGRKEVFADVTGGYSNPIGVYVTATSESTYDTITLTDRHGYRCVFNAEGRLWRCIDRNGNTTECSYNYAGQLETITDDRGMTWEVVYHTHGRVEKVRDKVWDDTTPREIEYSYDSDGDLTEQKAPETERYDDAGGNRTTYGYRYDYEHKLTACINPREFDESSEPIAYLENFYDSNDRVIDQRLGTEADVLDTHITKSAFIRLRYESSTFIHEIDRSGHRTDYTIDASGRVSTVERYTAFWSVDTDEPIDHSAVTKLKNALRDYEQGGGAGFTTFDTTFTYTANHDVLTTVYPLGNKVAYTYPIGTDLAEADSDFCSDTVLTDISASFTPGAFAGMVLRMGSDASEFKYYSVVNNTATTITILSEGFSLSGDGWGADHYLVSSIDPMALGNVLKVTRSDEMLGSLADIVTEYTYENRFQMVSTVKDPRGYTTSYTYDYEESAGNGPDAGNLVKVTSPSISGSMAVTGSIVTRTAYNEFGQPVATVDGEGNITRFEYYPTSDMNGRAGFLKHTISAWGELNLKSEYDYDSVGNRIASWSPRAFESGATKDDFKTEFEVNELNQTWHVTSKYVVGYDDSALMTTSSLESVDSYQYFDLNGNLAQSFREYITDVGGSPTNPTGANKHDPSWFAAYKSSSAMAATWIENSYEYNLLNYTTSSTVDAIASPGITRYTSRTEYDSNYNAISGISPLGNRNLRVLDERDLTYQSIAGAESDVMATFTSNYDKNGNLISSVDALGNTSTYTYDGFDRQIKSTDAGGNYRTTTYDANSNTLTSSAYDAFDVLLTHSETVYDEASRGYISKRMANDHNGIPIGDGWSTNTTVLDKNSRVVKSTNDNGVSHYTFYDGANRTTRSVDAVGNESRFTYNAHGATTKVDYIEVNGLNGTLEKSHVTYVLNRSDVAWEVQDRRYTETTFDTSGYTRRDGQGRVTLSKDAADTVVTHEYDLLSRTTKTTRSPGGASPDIVTMIDYDNDSRTVAKRVSNNPPTNNDWQETQFTYDERSRLIEMRRADGDLFTYSYDANSNQIGWTDPLGNVVTNTYDERNLIAFRHIDRAAGETNVTPPTLGATYESYSYDGLGRLDSCSNYEGSELISASDWQYNTLSLPEVQTQIVGRMNPLYVIGYPRTANTDQNAFTVKVRYDATGFVVGNIGWDGRETVNTPDELNRLSTVHDFDNNELLAVHLYAGPGRLIERTSGNGMRTSVEYESSGCGCGGATNFVERVEHVDCSGNTVFATNRVYDTVGNVKAENQDHWGEIGRVFTYDNTYRLTNAFQGIDLWEDASNGNKLSGWRTSSSLPSADADGIHASTVYRLDQHGNRTDVEQWLDTTTGAVRNDVYTVDTNNMNTYATVAGQSYEYDDNEQRFYDPTTGLYSAFDYKGQLAVQATDVNMSTPVRSYDYDNQGRLLLEDNSGLSGLDSEQVADQTVSVNTCGSAGGCGCGSSGNASGDPKLADIVTDSYGLMLNTTAYDYGVAIAAPGSSQTFSPLTVPGPSGPGVAGNAPIHDAVWVLDGPTFGRYQHEDQLGSLIGTTDDDCRPLDEIIYSEYGEPLAQSVAFSARPEDISSVSYNATYKETTINFVMGVTPPGNMDGMEVRVALPGDTTKRYRTARVQHDGGSLVLWEPTATYVPMGTDETVAGAIDPAGSIDAGFVVYDNPSGMLDGRWDSVTFDGTHTVFSDSERSFDSSIDGKYVELKAGDAGLYLQVLYDSPGNLKVLGDKTASVGANDRYRAPDANSGGVEEPNSGIWTDTATYDSMNDETTFYAEPACVFSGHQVGWKVLLNTQRPSYYEIKSVSGSELVVAGDLTSPTMAGAGDWFRIITPYGVDSDNGRLSANPWPTTPRTRTWAGYRYMPPAVGATDLTGLISLGTEQIGGNETGGYHCYNRE
ncbi:MAG: hypothetical protein KDB68_11635, partial [Planctomycetes bacterium]|nr:hypothetical protein [Planctomycetota bacterium]